MVLEAIMLSALVWKRMGIVMFVFARDRKA
jgi:hypothetical protein